MSLGGVGKVDKRREEPLENRKRFDRSSLNAVNLAIQVRTIVIGGKGKPKTGDKKINKNR